MNWNWVDIAVLSVIGLSVLIGIFRGFIREALSLVNWGLAIAAGVYCHDWAVAYLASYIHSEPVRSVVAFGGVFFIVLIICSIISHLIGLLVKKSGLGGTDRMLGLVFGFCRGLLVCAVILLVMSFTPVKSQAVWKEAVSVPFFVPMMAWLNDNIPSQVNIAKEALNRSTDKLPSASQTPETMTNIALLHPVLDH